MKKVFISLIIVIAATLSANAQRLSTQQFLVRKITFSADDQIVPISGVSVEINQARFRSDQAGQFTANIPVSNDMGFYISNITAPGYIVSIPEDLSKKIYLSSNQYVIVLADINAVKNERDRIYNNNKAAIARHEERLNAEIKKNQELLNEIAKKSSEYNTISAELEKARQQLESFKKAKTDMENKIDSLSAHLSLVDVASLSPEEQTRLKMEKEGKWIDAIVDEVISQIESNINTKYRKKLNEFEILMEEISNDYYHKFIEGNQPFAVNYFASSYDEYLRVTISNMKKNKDNVIDRMLNKVIEEDINEIIGEYSDKCNEKWRIKNIGTDSKVLEAGAPRGLESAKEDFLSWAMYPDKERSLRQVWKPIWNNQSIDEGVINTLRKVYPDYYSLCKNAADKHVEKYKDMTGEELYNLADESERAKIRLATEDAIRVKAIESGKISSIYYEFEGVMYYAVAMEALEPLRNKYNALVEKDIKEVEKMDFPSLASKIRPISPQDEKSTEINWENDKYIESYRSEYEKYEIEYPEYTSFLYGIVMEFLQPIINKYSDDKALRVWKSLMDDDVDEYCFLPIRNYQNRLSYIPNVAGSDKMCMNIVRAIIEIEKDKIITDHNERIRNAKKVEEKKEQTAIANLKTNKRRFDNEKDILAFLATHKFVNEEYERSSWFDSKITKMFLWMGQFEASNEISYTIIEWNSNSAKLKVKSNRGGSPIIVSIQINSTSASYSESCSGMTINYSVIDK